VAESELDWLMILCQKRQPQSYCAEVVVSGRKILAKRKDEILVLKVSPSKIPKYQIRVVLCQPKKIPSPPSPNPQHTSCGENEWQSAS
jgi:hypothetical protein